MQPQIEAYPEILNTWTLMSKYEIIMSKPYVMQGHPKNFMRFPTLHLAIAPSSLKSVFMS